MGLSPGGNDGPVAILRCKWCSYRPQWSCNHPTRGFLLRVDLAKPKRTPTLAQEWALDRAMAARQTCGDCGRRFFFCLSKKLGWPVNRTKSAVFAGQARYLLASRGA
ncbi:RRQRL motif-containing zinc-binding protein [Streptomyces coeruleorubidus]|uniref:RRQRL motif-containing zinc-binding protein n=1 Tax=Streptomyces coeruleorubidus TaxID=116188 RepID=UPI00380FAAAD